MANIYHKDLSGEHLHQPFWTGSDASKPVTPSVGDWYYATDIDVLYKCTSVGTWEFYPRKIGKGADYIEVADDGFLTLHGDARPSKVVTFACENWYPTFHKPLGIKALADPGYISSTLTTQPDDSRRIRIYGVGNGIHKKGEKRSVWETGDTSHNAVMAYVELKTLLVHWTQATEWRLVLDISVGDVTGYYTIHLPPFNIDAYEGITFWITNDGATYYGSNGECSFKHWAAGQSAEEADVNATDVYKGDNVVCPILDTTGFYIADKARLEDGVNGEWDRITNIVTNTSITIKHLDYDYTGANIKIKKVKCVESPYGITHMRRGIGRMCCMRAGVPSGIAGHYPFPFTQDENSPIKVALVFCGSIDNPTSETVRMRLQYIPTGPGDNALSEEWGKMKYITVTPGATAGDFVETLFTSGFEIPAVELLTKKAVQLQLVRMGNDPADTYTGCFLLVAILIGMTEKHIGADMRM